MVLASDEESLLPVSEGGARRRGLIRAAVSQRQPCSSVRRMLNNVGLNIRQVDRRPSLSVVGDDYFVEVEADGVCELDAWGAAVRAASERIHGRVLGTWL